MKEIVWLGPMGQDDASQRAKEIAQYSLTQLCSEYGFSLYYPQTLKAENWLEELIRKIRSSNGVICDLTGDRCNVYFEFGFAYALGIPRILICRTGTPVHTDLHNIQYHTYSTMNEVESIVKGWLQTLSAQEYNLSKVTDSLPHQFQILEGDGHHEYVHDVRRHQGAFLIEEIEAPITLESISKSQPNVGNLLLKIHELQAEVAKKTSRPFFSGELLGYVQHTPQRDESGTCLGARVGVRRTDYYTFAASHYPFMALDDACELSMIDSTKATTLRNQIKDQINLSSWPFVQPLTAMVFLVAELNGNRRVYFQQRDTRRNFHARYPKQATAGGMIHPSRIFDQQGLALYSPEITFLHELCEEAGIAVDRTNLKILGLVQETQWQECGFVGYVLAGKDQLDNRKLPIDSFESETFESVPLQPSHITTYLKEKARGGKDLSPLTLATLSLLLIHEFGLATMVKIFHNATA